MTILYAVLFTFAMAGVSAWAGTKLLEYDNRLRNKKTRTSWDKIFPVIRWVSYIPVGLIVAGSFGAIAESLFIGLGIGSGIIFNLVDTMTRFAFIAICFYVIIPVLDKVIRTRMTALTLAIFYGIFLYMAISVLYRTGRSIDDILNAIIIGLVFVMSIYGIIKPKIL